MNEFLIFCVWAVICVAILGGLYWGLQSTSLPQPIKVVIIIVIACVGLLYFLQSGYMPNPR